MVKIKINIIEKNGTSIAQTECVVSDFIIDMAEKIDQREIKIDVEKVTVEKGLIWLHGAKILNRIFTLASIPVIPEMDFVTAEDRVSELRDYNLNCALYGYRLGEMDPMERLIYHQTMMLRFRPAHRYVLKEDAVRSKYTKEEFINDVAVHVLKEKPPSFRDLHHVYAVYNL